MVIANLNESSACGGNDILDVLTAQSEMKVFMVRGTWRYGMGRAFWGGVLALYNQWKCPEIMSMIYRRANRKRNTGRPL